jgi:N-acyl-D-aspartate/D-glutamate deacylase
MRFLRIYRSAERNTPPTPEEMADMGKLVEEGMKAGWLFPAKAACLQNMVRGFGKPAAS